MAKKDSTLVRLGANVREARERKGWSQEELAYHAGVHRTYVGAVERGEYNVTILSLIRIITPLGLPLREATKGIRP